MQLFIILTAFRYYKISCYRNKQNFTRSHVFTIDGQPTFLTWYQEEPENYASILITDIKFKIIKHKALPGTRKR